jgi:hypothetical protein
MSRRSFSWGTAFIVSPVLIALGCSGTPPPTCDVSSVGGGSGTDPCAETGGTSTVGGTWSLGGTSNSGGSPSSGGVSTAGGTEGIGGTSAVGGSLATGGTSAATGGESSTGGSLATGGTSAATGGESSTGGASATGGTSAATGGESGAGGTSATGGSQSTGGATATGGASTTTGGSQSTGGATATGGTSATGGSSATGGTSSSSTSPEDIYCGTAPVTNLGVLPAGGTAPQQTIVSTEPVCFRFSSANASDLFKGIQASNCGRATVSVNGQTVCQPPAGTVNSTTCGSAISIPRAADGYWYILFDNANTSTISSCQSNWWWWH